MTDHCSHGLSRRHFLTAATLGSVALMFHGMDLAMASDHPSGITPDEAMKRLKEGNERFLNGKTSRPHVTKEWLLETYNHGQHPFATVIACSDSRVPVEELFDQGVGDIFTIRVAGNVIHTDETGSTEYGAAHLGTPLVLVMGHTKCGAVTAVSRAKSSAAAFPNWWMSSPLPPHVPRPKA